MQTFRNHTIKVEPLQGDSDGIHDSNDLNRCNYVYRISFLAGWSVWLKQGIRTVTFPMTPKTTFLLQLR